MFRSLIRSASFARKAGTSRREKFSIFFTMLRLDHKNKYRSEKSKECSESLFGFTVWGYNYFLLSYLYKEVFLSKEYFFESGTDSPVIFDCGSNIGMSVLYFKYLFPKSKIKAFEPNPHAFKMLKKNMEVNKITGVELNEVALSNHEGEISFFINDPGTLLGSVRHDRGGENELKARADRLSNYFRSADKIDLVKIDVEGSESLIIDDLLESSCIEKPDQYIIEYHHHINEDAPALSAFLKKFEMNGFDYNIRAEFNRPGSFQDILIHFYKRK